MNNDDKLALAAENLARHLAENPYNDNTRLKRSTAVLLDNLVQRWLIKKFADERQRQDALKQHAFYERLHREKTQFTT